MSEPGFPAERLGAGEAAATTARPRGGQSPAGVRPAAPAAGHVLAHSACAGEAAAPVARAPYSVGLCLRARCDRRLHNPAGTAASTAPRRHLHVTFTLPPVREVTARCGRPRARRGRGSQGRTRPARGTPSGGGRPGRRARDGHGGHGPEVCSTTWRPGTPERLVPDPAVTGPRANSLAGAVIDGPRAGHGTGRAPGARGLRRRSGAVGGRRPRPRVPVCGGPHGRRARPARRRCPTRPEGTPSANPTSIARNRIIISKLHMWSERSELNDR